MHTTAEVRWFLAGPIPDAVSQWFHRGRQVTREKTRTDEYLPLPSGSAGVKFRQGTFEIKALVDDAAIRTWNGVSGRRQIWVKWSCGAAEIAAMQRRVRRSTPLVAIEKTRSVRRFSFDRTLRQVPAVAERLPPDGCTMKLTALRAAEASYWTFGLEAFGFAHPDRITDILDATAERIFTARRAPRRSPRAVADHLSVDCSMSYPEWIARLSSAAE